MLSCLKGRNNYNLFTTMINKKEAMPFPENLSEEETQTMSKKYESSKEEIEELIKRGVKAEDIESFLQETMGLDEDNRNVFIETYLLAEKDWTLFADTINKAKNDPEKLKEMCEQAKQYEKRGGLSGASR